MTTALFQAAVAHQSAGRIAEAEALLRQVLAAEPQHGHAMFLLGGLALASGRANDAIGWLRGAASLDPANAVYAYGLGEAHRQCGQLGEAIGSFCRALSLRPDFAEALMQMSLVLEQLEQRDLATAYFQTAAEIAENDPALPRHLDRMLRERAASDARQGASPVTRDPFWGGVWLALALSCSARKRKAPAIEYHRRALEHAPDWALANLGLGLLLREAGADDEAELHLERALNGVDPAGAPQLDRAAIVQAASMLANIYKGTLRHEQAIALLRRCLELDRLPRLHSFLIMLLAYVRGHDEAAIAAEARAWERAHVSSIEPARTPFANEPSPDRRLRIGYVSPAFRNHVHKFFLDPLFSNHDRQAFEVFLYSDVSQPDEDSARLRSYADAWVGTHSLDDDALAERIRRDRIDVLVDLSMHTEDNRLALFARKPAPVQMCWLAYPGTSGLSSMDYRITDPHLDPGSVDLSIYSETSLHLPDSFWCYSSREAPAVAPLPALRAGRVTFGSLNNFVKVNLDVLATWADVLQAVPGSRLVLLAPEGEVRARTARVFAERGVAPERVSFVGRRQREEYLASHAEIDVVLDPFPYSGHTTSLDAFWMGVPVVTLAGSTVIGRAGVSIAKNLGLSELIATSTAEYVAVAQRLCADLEALSALRDGLRQRMQASPLMDGRRFARNLEALYREAWQRWAAR